MATKLFGKDLKQYEDVDIDTLLTKLTADELDELNNEVDPDNSLLPPNQRCRDQTTKEPTGPFQREQLLRYLEEKAKNEKDWDEKLPFRAGVKRGKTFVPKHAGIFPESGDGDMPIELDVDDEFEVAMSGACEQDLVDLAGILGMHSMLNQTQYYNALKGKPQDTESGSFVGIVKSTMHKVMPAEPPNQTDVPDCTRRLTANDPTLTTVNINNMKEVSREQIRELILSMRKNTHLEKFSMANTATKDADVRPLIDVLETNRTLTSLNVESNFLSGEMLAELMNATLRNQTLIEFHAENQRAAVLGNKVEMEIMKAVEENENILRVGMAFQSMEARHRVSEALERNYEKIRLKRIGDL